MQLEEKPINPSNETMQYFNKKIRGNYCEHCKKTFEDGQIIHTPEIVAENGDKIVTYFCDIFCREAYTDKLKK